MTTNLDSALACALINHNDIEVSELLKKAHEGLGGVYSLAYALIEMMPPFENYDTATDVLVQLYGGADERIAAIFAGYIFVNLQPFDNGFESILINYKDCPVANYILSLYFDYENDVARAKAYIDKSTKQSLFAKNTILKLSFYSSDITNEEKIKLRMKLAELVTIKNFEKFEGATDKNEIVSDYFDELIIGSKMTSANWENIANKFSLADFQPK